MKSSTQAPLPKPTAELRSYFRELGKRYGAIGGRKKNANMTEDQRREHMRMMSLKGVAARKAKKAQRESRERFEDEDGPYVPLIAEPEPSTLGA